VYKHKNQIKTIHLCAK